MKFDLHYKKTQQALLSYTGDSTKMVQSDQIVNIRVALIDTTNEAKSWTFTAKHPKILDVELK